VATLGNGTIGFSFNVSGSFGQAAGGGYTVPSQGIFIDGINVYAGRNGSLSTDRLYVWRETSGQPSFWMVRSGTFNLPVSKAWNNRTDLSPNGSYLSADGYVPGGWVIWIGLNASTGILAYEGASGSSGTDLGNTNDGDFSYHDFAHGGIGLLAAYIDYHVLAVPTLTNAAPNVGTNGTTTTLTGTNLSHATAVTVNGTAASWSVTDDSHLVVTVPSGATPGVGSIVVTTPAGSASIAFTVGQIFFGTGSAVSSIAAVWYGDPSGSGVPHKVAGVWVPDGGGGVKRVW
jgi:hypothetical protein